MHTVNRQIARIGAYELDVRTAELRRSGHLVALNGQPMRVLILLVQRAGQIVTRDELRHEIWGADTHVDFEAGLSTCINQIRVALGDRAVAPRFIETLPKRGYRFVAPVVWAEPLSSTSPAAPAAVAPPTAATPSRVRRLIPAVAIVSLLAALGTWVVAKQLSAGPIPIAVIPVDDTGSAELRRMGDSLSDVLIGALSSAAGPRARVTSPVAARPFRTMDVAQIRDAGIKYIVYITLRSFDDQVLVHVKLVDTEGFTRGVSDRTLPIAELGRQQLRIAGEAANDMVREIWPQDDPR